MPEVKIDLEKCDGDGICVDVCPVAVFELKEEGGNTKSYVVNQDECLVCEHVKVNISKSIFVFTFLSINGGQNEEKLSINFNTDNYNVFQCTFCRSA